MDQEMNEIFAPLQAAIMAREYSKADVFDLLGSFAEGTPVVAAAMCFHLRDYFTTEETESTPWNAVLCELYRRTFFDIETATLYGTQEMAQQGPALMRQFVEFLSGNLRMDSAIDHASAGNHFPEQQSNHSH